MRNIRQLLVAFLMSAVVACGGGGTIGETTGGTPATPTFTVSLALTDSVGTTAKDVSKATPLKVKATVKASSGSAANKLVTFTVNDTALATFDNGAGTAQTAADGVATIGLIAGSKSGAGEISASVDGGTPVKIAFTSAGDNGSDNLVIILSSSSANGGSSTMVSKTNSLILTAVLKSASGQVQAGKLIRFSLDNAELASFSNDAGTAETDSNGVATIGLNVGTKSGSGEIIAMVDGGSPFKMSFSSAGDVLSPSSLLTLNITSFGTGSATQVSKNNPLLLTATLKSITGEPLAGKLVRFSLDNNELANFNNDSGTAETNSSGVAIIGLIAGSKSGAGEVTASVDGATPIKVSFTSAGDNGAGTFVLTLKTTSAGTGSNTRVSADNPLIITSTVTSVAGVPQPGKLVRFRIDNTQLASFNNEAGTAESDKDGIATIGLIAGSQTGTGEITASIDGGAPVKVTFTSAGDNGASTFVITLSSASSNGGSATQVSKANPLIVTAVLKSASGQVQAGKLIRFSLDNSELASFSNDAGTAVTNSSGVATIGLNVGTKSGSGEVIARIDDGVPFKLSFSSAGDASSPSSLLTLNITSFGTGSATLVSKSNPLLLTATLKSITGEPLVGKLVRFSLDNNELANFNNDSGTAETNSSGVAIIGLIAGSKSGAGEVTASVDGATPIKVSFTSAGDNGAGTFVLTLKTTSAGTGSTSEVGKDNPLVVTSEVTSVAGVPQPGKLVRFKLDNTELASFNNDTGTAETNSNGIATIGLIAGSKSGAGEITASIDGGAPVKVAFTSLGDNGEGVFVITLDTASVGSGSNNVVGKENPLLLTSTVNSLTGVPQPGKLVRFELDNTELASFNNDAGTAETDSNGVATIILNAGTKSGAGVITASLDGNSNVVTTKTFTSLGDGGTVDTTPVGSILLYADKLQLGAGSADRVELSALVRDKNNVLMKNVKVQFSADNDSELEIVSDVTGNDGVAKANLSSKTNFSIRNVKVTATAGSESKTSTVDIGVVGTRLDILSPNAVVLAGNTDITFSLQDSAGNGIKDTVIEISSSLNNTFSSNNPRTDAATGRVIVNYKALNRGTDIITAKALGVTTTFSLFIDPDSFEFDPIATEIPEITLGESKTLAVKWLRDQSPLVGNEVMFATTRGEITATGTPFSSQVVTKANTNNAGLAQVDVRSQFAGVTSIAASSTAVGTNISTSQLVEFVSKTPDVQKGIEVQAFPAQIGVTEKSSIVAVVRDANDNPVKNQIVAFSLAETAGGQLNPSTAVTNSQGVATTEFTADSTTPGNGSPGSPTGLRINATLTQMPTVKGSTGITVGRRTLFFRFGSGNVIAKVQPNLYSVPYAIIVTDAAGNPVPNQQLNVSVTPNRFFKGGYFRSPLIGAFVSWKAAYAIREGCPSEDIDRDGLLDPGEDYNSNGQLTPGNVATVARTVTANSDGIAQFEIIYPREYANWVGVDISVTSNAAGTENVASRSLILQISGDDVGDEGVPPSDSPFGIGYDEIINDRTAFDGMAPSCADLR